MITITLPDKSTKQFPKGTTSLEIAKSISEGLARNAIAAIVDGKHVDLDRKLEHDADVRILTLKDPEGLFIIRHSAAHIVAQAVQRLYPDALRTIGPPIENGFYFDFDNLDITEEDLPKIEEEMRKIVKEKYPTVRKDYSSKKDAIHEYKDNPYKVEL